MRLNVLFLFLFFCCNALVSQNNVTLSGYVKDKRTGETLIGVNIANATKLSQGAATNTYGFYSLTLPKGNYTLKVTYVGYADKELPLNLTDDKVLNIEMEEGVELQAVEVTSESKDKNVRETKMGTVTIPIESIKKTPVLFGEADPLKVIQLLPGVKANEGSSGLYIRGGGIDQNLILLDEAIVYNPGHLLGFFSVFNADAIKNLTLIKGGMPAQYGGRLSSVVDIQMKEGNDKQLAYEGGIGLIASRFTLEGPIVKEKASFMISARRTYALDLAQGAISKTKFAGSNYYFYDLNAKMNYTLSEKDRVYLSTYFGRDVFKFSNVARGFEFNLPYGNATATLRWNHVFSKKLFLNVSGVYNDYDFSAGGGQDVFKFNVFSGVRDWNGKIDFDYFKSTEHTFKFGANFTYHRFTPNIVTGTNGDSTFTNANVLKPKYANEFSIYFGDDWKISPRLTLNIGARLSAFQQIGPYTASDSTMYANGEVVKTYSGFEPRLTGKYSINDASSLKFGITATTQYVHLVSNSTSSLPGDIWVPSSKVIEPQRGIQYALGYFKNFKDNTYEASVEVYYKDLQHQIDYQEYYVRKPKDDVQNSFVFGKGWAYGAEFFLRKSKGKLNGWVGYTWSRTLRQFPDINNGAPYPSTYDRIHDFTIVANYQASKKWELSANWVFATGNTFTPLKDLFITQQQFNLEYGDRNSARYEDYHRLDLGATYTPHPEKTGFRSSWSFSVYNAYNHYNPFFVYYDINNSLNSGTSKATSYAVTLFPIIPSVTWNFKFKGR